VGEDVEVDEQKQDLLLYQLLGTREFTSTCFA